MHRLLITGGRGFVGRAVAAAAASNGYAVRISSRLQAPTPMSAVELIQVASQGPATDWSRALEGIDCVVHCAGRAHVRSNATDSLPAFQTVNVDGTLNLARQAVAAGVRRLIFLSSVGVNGVETALGRRFCETDPPAPHNAYATSKWQAEQGLLAIANKSALEVVLIRPPLVYGYAAPGNFGALVRAVHRRLPLPLGCVRNQRSLLALDNLVHFVLACASHPGAANQTFLVCDGQDVSTPELVRALARAAGVHVALPCIPVPALRFAATMLGKRDLWQRLCSNLQIDISKARERLQWQPPVPVAAALHAAIMGENQ
jgi:UDP-glucose 4-epimerase